MIFTIIFAIASAAVVIMAKEDRKELALIAVLLSVGNYAILV